MMLAAAGCKFSEVPPLQDDGGIVDAPPASCTVEGPDPGCPPSSPICVDGACTGQCTVDADCDGRPPGQEVCHAGSGACVACDEDDVQADPGGNDDECPVAAVAVCDGDTHTCRVCEAHTECFSGICDDGRCAPVAEVVYLDPSGVDIASCTRAQPCLTLNKAIDEAQANPALDYIFMAADATPYSARAGTGAADFDNVSVHVVGYGATVIRTGQGPVLDIRNGADVRIDGLAVAEADGPSNGVGIQVAGDSRLELFEAIVRNNEYRGVSAFSSPTLVVRRSQILMNRGGGIFSDTGSAILVNNIIAGNGNLLTSTFGGVSLFVNEDPSTFEFNTIVLNSAPAGTTDGVICTGFTSVVRNNIIVGSATSPQTMGGCVHRFSLFTPAGPTGEGNVNIADQAMYQFTPDLHISAGSVAIDRGQATNLVGESMFDIDGDPRGGATVDVGADELP